MNEHDCKHCGLSAPVYAPDYWGNGHHAVCPKRPLEAGDYVRWEWYERWAEGSIDHIIAATGVAILRVDKRSDGPRTMVNSVLARNCRRIPRPTPEVRGEAMPVVEAPKQRTQCCKCGKYDTVSWECDCTAASRVRKRFDDRRIEHLTAPIVHRDVKPENVPPPTLIDGLTPYQCDERWCHNRTAVENGLAPEFVMTPDQIAAGRAAWQARNQPKLAGLLRAKLAESRERERNRVVVDLQDEP